jgi:hypothetical protein
MESALSDPDLPEGADAIAENRIFMGTRISRASLF